MSYTFMKEKAILPLVLSMSIPSIISMLVNSLYNIVDSFFVAQISEDAMTALSLVFPIQNLSLAVAVGFGVGINALIAALLGMGKTQDANRAASSGLVLCAAHGIVLMGVCLVILPWFLGLFSDSAQVLKLSMQYATIVLFFSIVHHTYIGAEKIYQSIGKMKTTMVIMMVGCACNIVLDPLMIFGIGPFPAMGIEGAAWATGIGQTIQLVLYAALYYLRPISLTFSLRNHAFKGNLVSKMYGVGIPASLNMALPSVLISVLNGVLAGFGQMYVVILGVYYKLQTFVYTPANGLMQGVRPLIGYNLGAQEFVRVQKLYRTTLGIAFVMMAIGVIICCVWAQSLMGLFTNNPETIAAGTTALRIISMGFLASAISVSACGCLEGLGMGKESFIISILRYVLLIIPCAVVLSMAIGVEGVWHAFWITEVVTAAMSFFLYRRSQEIAFNKF